jgi:hypothetical protein
MPSARGGATIVSAVVSPDMTATSSHSARAFRNARSDSSCQSVCSIELRSLPIDWNAPAGGAVALVAAVAVATVAPFFSVKGMAEIFPGAPVAVMVLAATMEAGKLVIAGWLAAHWQPVGWKMRSVLVALVAGLALINAAGVFGKLVEAHVSVAASARCSVAERIETLDILLTPNRISAPVVDERVAKILGADASIWSISAVGAHNDIVRRPEDVAAFAKLFRKTLDDIKLVHGENAAVNVFPAVPVSIAVESGRSWQPKAHPSLAIYDQNWKLGGFALAHRLEHAR